MQVVSTYLTFSCCVQAICDTAASRWQLQAVAIEHRVGLVAVGEPSVIIAVSSAHRRDALEVIHHP